VSVRDPATHAASSLPYQRLLSPRSALVAVLCWGPAQALLFHLEAIVRGAADVRSLVGVLAALVASVLAGLWALGANTRHRATMRVLLAVSGGGLVNVVVAVLTSYGELEGRYSVWTHTLVAMVAVQSMFELLFASWCALLVYGVYPHARANSHARADRVLLLGALWLLLPAIPIDVTNWTLGATGESRTEQTVSALLRIVLPLCAVAWIVARAAARRRWLERISRGEDARWRLLDRAGALQADLPRLDASDGKNDRTLVRVRDGGEAFRTAEYDEVALVGGGSE
jgi:hypothetical protein